MVVGICCGSSSGSGSIIGFGSSISSVIIVFGDAISGFYVSNVSSLCLLCRL